MKDPRDRMTEAFIQWKGTDVCMDVNCPCGKHNHYDGDFAYTIRCGGCGAVYEMPTHVPLKQPARTDMTPLEPIDD